MPRVLQRSEKQEHVFPWSMQIEPGQSVDLFKLPTEYPVRSIEMTVSDRYASFPHSHMFILAIGISSPDPFLRVDIGTAIWTYGGPWFQDPHKSVLGKVLEVPKRQSVAGTLVLPRGRYDKVPLDVRVFWRVVFVTSQEPR